MGMTDLQFKIHLRFLVATLKRAENADTLEKVLKIITALKSCFRKNL